MLVCPLGAQTHIAADLGHQILNAGLDADECYRVRDIEISEDDARFYLTDGYLMFGKPVNGAPADSRLFRRYRWRRRRSSAAAARPFRAQIDGGFTGAPNLNEHFARPRSSLPMTRRKSLLEQIQRERGTKKLPEIGAIMMERWGSLVAQSA